MGIMHAGGPLVFLRTIVFFLLFTLNIFAALQTFGEWFEHLKKLTVRNCEEDQVSVPRLAALMKKLPASRTAAEVPFLDDVFDDLELLNTPTEVFIALRYHLKYYVWHRLLGVIIDTLNLRGVEKEMSNFRESLHELFDKASVIDFIQAEQGKRVRPPNHSELVADFDWDEGVPLNWIDLFQQHYLDFYNLHHYVMLLGSVQLQDHFTVTWFVPDALTKDLKAALPYNLLTHFATFSLTIGGDAIYVNHGKDMVRKYTYIHKIIQVRKKVIIVGLKKWVNTFNQLFHLCDRHCFSLFAGVLSPKG